MKLMPPDVISILTVALIASVNIQPGYADRYIDESETYQSTDVQHQHSNNSDEEVFDSDSDADDESITENAPQTAEEYYIYESDDDTELLPADFY